MTTFLGFASLCALLALVVPEATAAPSPIPVRNHFIGLRDFSDFTRQSTDGETSWLSPPIEAGLDWNELVVSWNAQLPPGQWLKVEARGVYDTPPERATKFYTMGVWSPDATRHSVNGQQDADGDVQTDTLILKRHGAKLQLRLTLGAAPATPGVLPAPTPKQESLRALHFIGLSFLNDAVRLSDDIVAAPSEGRAAWGRVLPVPQRFQYDYEKEGGAVWCSPTSTSMILEHWGNVLQCWELNRSVPDTARAVHDPAWIGTGNWVFNTADAGSFPGLRAYVTRFDGMAELEQWIAAGVPVALSVSSDLLRGRPLKGDGSGHLVVCVGFTENGDVVLNDPARRPAPGQPYQVFSRAAVIAGWGHSKNTVYLIYPENAALPRDALGHWDNAAR